MQPDTDKWRDKCCLRGSTIAAKLRLRPFSQFNHLATRQRGGVYLDNLESRSVEQLLPLGHGTLDAAEEQPHAQVQTGCEPVYVLIGHHKVVDQDAASFRIHGRHNVLQDADAFVVLPIVHDSPEEIDSSA